MPRRLPALRAGRAAAHAHGRAASSGLLALALVLALAGCGPSSTASGSASPSGPGGSSSPAACDAVAPTLLGVVQRYVDQYAGTGAAPTSTASPSATPSAAPTEDDLRDAIATARSEVRERGCDAKTFQSDVASGLGKVRADGALAKAVILRLTASVTGTAATKARTVSVAPGQSLARAVARLAPGSTVRLGAGRHVLKGPLVLLAGLTVRGAGRERTTVESAAAGSAVLVLNGDRTAFTDLTLRHTGTRPASVLVGGPASSVVLTRVRVSGGLAPKSGAGKDVAGSGVAMTARPDEETPRGTTLQVTGSNLSGNATAGVLVTGAHRASIRSSTLSDNGQCGVCFAGGSGGAVRGSTFTDNAVGVAVFDRAAPSLTDLRISGGQVGVQVNASGAPTLSRVTVDQAARAGFIYSGKANGRLARSRCVGTPYGVVVGPKAYPLVGGAVRCKLSASG